MKAKIWNANCWVTETEEPELTADCRALLEKSGFTILNYMQHNFEPQGFTAIWLLAESHLAVHTFPEENKSYIELSSCNEEKNDRFWDLFGVVFTKVFADA